MSRELYQQKTVAQLKQLLLDRNLPITGIKNILINRLLSLQHGSKYDRLKVGELKDLLKHRNLSVIGHKAELISRLERDDTLKDTGPRTSRMPSLSKYEQLTKDRDEIYYDNIKHLVSTLPNIIGSQFESKEAKQSIKWELDEQWQAIYYELETLDSSGIRGDDGEFDKSIINFITTFNPKKRTNVESLNKMSNDHDELVKFVTTYPT